MMHHEKVLCIGEWAKTLTFCCYIHLCFAFQNCMSHFLFRIQHFVVFVVFIVSPAILGAADELNQLIHASGKTLNYLSYTHI